MGLKESYADVVEAAKQNGVSLTHVHEQDGKLVITGNVQYAYDRDKVWDVIKAKHPNWQAETMVDIRAQQAEPYGVWTVKGGDTLSKIAKTVYDDMKQYTRIFEANRDQLKDPDKIQVGQQLKLPPKQAAGVA
jgi:nucleoid-associated protein YgaU